MMATIQDVAKRAGVGAATVSRVLNGNGYVKTETRERIQDAIDELAYTPNEMARNLFYRKNQIVAVIVPELAHPFFSEVVNAVEVALSAVGYQAMVCNTFYEQSYELQYIDMLKRQSVDGIIFAAHTSEGLEEYANLQRPIVAIDRILGKYIPCVRADHESGGRMAAEELIACGCRNVVQFVGKDERVTSAYDKRHEVFAGVMAQKGIKCHSIGIQWSSFSSEQYQQCAKEAFDLYPDLDGVFGADLYAMASLQYALSIGRRVPEDTCIVAYDGTNMTRFLTPKLTTICQPMEQLGKEAVRLIMDKIEGKKNVDRSVILPVEFRWGQTTVSR